MVEFKVEGLVDVLAEMKKLTVEMRGKVSRSSVRKGANIIRDAARAGWDRVDREETPNDIAEKITVQFAGKTFRRTGDVMFRVGIRGGATAKGVPVFYWRFYELGSSSQRARPVMQPALFNNAGKAFAAVATEMNRQFKKLGKGPG